MPTAPAAPAVLAPPPALPRSPASGGTSSTLSTASSCKCLGIALVVVQRWEAGNESAHAAKARPGSAAAARVAAALVGLLRSGAGCSRSAVDASCFLGCPGAQGRQEAGSQRGCEPCSGEPGRGPPLQHRSLSKMQQQRGRPAPGLLSLSFNQVRPTEPLPRVWGGMQRTAAMAAAREGGRSARRAPTAMSASGAGGLPLVHRLVAIARCCTHYHGRCAGVRRITAVGLRAWRMALPCTTASPTRSRCGGTVLASHGSLTAPPKAALVARRLSALRTRARGC